MELLRNGTGVNRIDAEKCFNELVLPIFPEADKNKYFKVLQEWYSNIYAPTTSARRKVYPQNFLHQLADALNLRTVNDETALRDLGLFSDIIKDVEQTYVSIDSEWRYREMLNFLENIAQNYELDSVDYISKVDAVNVSTIHKVKGLEYPVVFVVDLVNQRFPGKRGQYNGILPEELMTNAIDRGAYGNRAEDEARLFYTAITRAERLLYLTGSEIHPGLKTKKKHSVFTADLKHSDMRYDTSLDILADKIEPVPRFDDNELPTDFSSVKSYLTCPFMYKLQNIYGYNAAVKEDKTKNINAAEVIDFKSMEVPDGLEEFDWREMSLQVQLYSRAAKEVIGENAETGYVHTLKNNKRVEVPVDETAVKNAIGAIEWAVKGILQEDFPMRACSSNCKNCDYRALCRQEREPFKRQELPPVINTPVGERVIAAFEEEDGEF